MEKITKGLRFWLLLQKRFLKKKEFVAILLLLPVLALALGMSVREESGMLRVALVLEDPADAAGHRAIERLLQKKTVSYQVLQTAQEAEQQVKDGRIDAAWVLRRDWAQGREGAVLVIEPEETVLTQLAKTQLYGELYPELSYEICRRFLIEEMQLTVPEAESRALYEANLLEESLFAFAYLESDGAQETPASYLMAPLRSMLGAWLMLCGLAASLFYLQDRQSGVFVRIPQRKQSWFALGYHMLVLADGALAVLITLCLSGILTGIWREIAQLAWFALTAGLWSSLWCRMLRTPKAAVAGLLVTLMLALFICPVFIDLPGMYVPRHVFPLYYYLYGAHNPAIRHRQAVFALLLLAVYGGISFAGGRLSLSLQESVRNT